MNASPKTMTINNVIQRHQGLSSKKIQLMLLRGELKGRKVDNIWHVSVADLDRVFGG